MGHRGYRSWRSRGWRTSQPSKYSKLSGLFGDAVVDIKRAFLNLDSDARDELFSDYGDMYGENAEKYARKTFPAWKTGSTQLSGQTMERLVELVPPYLPSSVRLEILKVVLQKHKKSGSFARISIDVKEPSEGFAKLDAEIKKMNITDQLAFLPERVMSAASWLYDNDVTAARAVLAEATKVENEILRKNALKEIELLKRTIQSGQVRSASYTVEMPAGSLQVIAFTPSMLSSIIKCFK